MSDESLRMSTDKILTALSRATSALFREKDFGRAVGAFLRGLGAATGVSRVYVFENHVGPRGELLASPRYEWVAPGIAHRIGKRAVQRVRWSRFKSLRDQLHRKPVCGPAHTMSASLRRMCESPQILSRALFPVYANRSWFGFIGFDDWLAPRRWSMTEIEALRAAANAFGGAIERHRMQQRLRIAEKKYRDLVERMSEGLSYYDERNIITYANRGLCRMLGYPPREVTGRNIESFLDEKGKETLRSHVRRRRKGKSSRCELSLRSRSGAMVSALVSVVPVFDEKGSFRGGFALFADITERKRLEVLKDDILTEASHELKTPTAKIKMGLDLLKAHRREPMDDEERLGMRMIEQSVARLQRNADSLTDLSAFDSGLMKLRREKINLGDFLSGVVAEHFVRAREKGLSLVCRPGRGKLIFSGDREKMYHLFRDLLENAIKFSTAGTIAVSAKMGKGEIAVSVSDEGRGIEPAYLEKIFERHYQRHPREPGMGLGLTLCRKIVELHRGRMWAESKGPVKGMTIHISLPMASGKRRK